jgi:hypothetical protein
MKNNRNRLINNSLFYILLFVVLVLQQVGLLVVNPQINLKTLSQDQFITQLKKEKLRVLKSSLSEELIK